MKPNPHVRIVGVKEALFDSYNASFPDECV